MDINALDQLLRGDQPAAARRSSSSSGDKHFSSLLDAQTARARSQSGSLHPAELQGRDNKSTVKTAPRPERSDAAETARSRRSDDDRPVRAKDARPKDDDAPRNVRKDDDRASAADGRKDRNDTADMNRGDDDARHDDNAKRVDRREAKVVRGDGAKADDAKAAPTPEAAKPADATDANVEPAKVDADIAAPADVAAQPAPSPASIVPLAVPVAVAVPVVALAASVDDENAADAALEAPVEGDDAKAAASALPAAASPADAKPAADAGKTKAADAAAQISLPTATLAATEKKPEHATEEFADFMLRNAGAAQAAAAGGEAAKDQVKADADANEGRVAVTVAQPMGAAPVAAPVAPVTAFAVQAAVSNDNVALDAVKAAGSGKGAVPVEAEEGKPVAKDPAPVNPAFAQALDAARAADAPEAPKATAPRTPLVPMHEQVAVQIRKAAAEGLDQIRIHLNPGELGRIDVKLDVSSDGTLRASFAAEKQQTLELLKNDSRQLENSLQQAGFKADAGGLNFSMRGDNRENAQAFRDLGAQNQSRSGGRDDAADAAAPAPATYSRRRAANGRVDLNA